MAIFETYYERMRRLEKGDTADVYVYDVIPDKLKHQIIHIWDKAFRELSYDKSHETYAVMEKTMAEAMGVPNLTRRSDPYESCKAWLLEMARVEPALSLVELSALMMKFHGKADFIDDLNFRFRQSGIGYQIENCKIIKIDDQFVHAEIVKPAIRLLASDPVFKTANADFMTAHAHYRARENKQAVTLAGSAFESTLKAICKMKGWPYEKGARATDLIKVVNAEGLFPDYLDKGFETYIAAMKTGLPGVRNDAGPHGTAPETPKVPDYIAAYAIHLSAVNIVLAIEAANA
ncbi:STM4504/CBY_0614 family protein [Bradyrhizobium oligotrophicum]|uniref:STM4504/CBY_0614 family protein n=1 Tax=Bradyrhizobium oligotrophicum TaxID=44255 RepID=UPI003EB88ED8